MAQMDWGDAVDDSDTVTLHKLNEVFFRVCTSPDIHQEMTDYFKFRAQNFQFNPKYKNKIWDGYIRIYKNGKLYIGLLPMLKEFCEEREYKLDVNGEVKTDLVDYPPEYAKELYASFNLDPERFQLRDYQIEAMTYAFNQERALLVSATASGKSLILYSLIRHFNLKTLLIVPRVALAYQLVGDFVDYATNDDFDAKKECYPIFAGQDKNSPALVYVSTWQSLQNMPPDYFSQFHMLIVDEVHEAKAAQLTKICEACTNAPYRFGTTGSLDNFDCHEWILQGLFGLKKTVSTTRNLIERGILPPLKINCVVLEYGEKTRKDSKKLLYKEEIDFISNHHKRNRFICKLAIKQEKNTLVMFRHRAHGKKLFDEISKLNTDPERKIFLIDGHVEAEIREKARTIVDTQKNAVIVASEGVFSTGINIKSLDVLIFAAPSKARIKIIQSIGRILRKGDDTSYVTVFDIVDDMQWKKRKNYAIQHFLERAKIYAAEKHKYRLLKIDLREQSCLKLQPMKSSPVSASSS